MVEDDVDHRNDCNENADVGGDKLCVPVHEENHDQRREYQGGQYEVDGVDKNPYLIGDKDPYQRVERLDHRVAGRDLRTAGAAFSFEQAPADDRDKIAALDLCAAGHTVGIALDKRLLLRQTVDADVEKAPHRRSEQENKQVNNTVVDVVLCTQGYDLLWFDMIIF